MSKKKRLLDLFLTFLKIGAFTFGGGYAMIPLIQREAVEKQGWISEDEVLEIVAIAESTPGPIAVNSATFVGYKAAGVWGAFCATFGVVLPSFVIIALLTQALDVFQHIRLIQYAFFGIRAGVLALILKALVKMFRQSKRDGFSLCIMGLAFVATAVLKLNAIAAIALSAGLGLAFSVLSERRMKQ